MASDLYGLPEYARATGDLDGFPPRVIGTHYKDGPLVFSTPQALTTRYQWPLMAPNGIGIAPILSGEPQQIWRTLDGGREWKLLTASNGVPSAEFKQLATDGRGNWLICCGNSGQSNVYVYSRDNGTTWQTAPAPGGTAFYFGCGYAGGRWWLGIYSSYSVFSSPDLISWTASSLGSISNSRTFTGFADDTLPYVFNMGEGIASMQMWTPWGGWNTVGSATATAAQAAANRDIIIWPNGTQNYNYVQAKDCRSGGVTIRTSSFPVSGNWARPVWDRNTGLFFCSTYSDASPLYCVSEDGINWKGPWSHPNGLQSMFFCSDYSVGLMQFNIANGKFCHCFWRNN